MSDEYDDDRPGMMRIHIAQRRGAEMANKYTYTYLRLLAKEHGVPPYVRKYDLAVALAMAGVKP